MEYKFYCDCGNEQTIAIPMDEYDEKRSKQVCCKCGKILKRKFEPFSGSIQLTNGMYGVGSGGWNS